MAGWVDYVDHGCGDGHENNDDGHENDDNDHENDDNGQNNCDDGDHKMMMMVMKMMMMVIKMMIMVLIIVMMVMTQVYQCTADNGVGSPVTRKISLRVLCKLFAQTHINTLTHLPKPTLTHCSQHKRVYL